jgi:hypothetical protein
VPVSMPACRMAPRACGEIVTLSERGLTPGVAFGDPS